MNTYYDNSGVSTSIFGGGNSNNKLGGWLIGFLIFIGLVCVLDLYATIEGNDDFSSAFSGTAVTLRWLYTIAFFVTGGYVIFSFLRRKPDAVAAGKLFAVLPSVYPIVCIFTGSNILSGYIIFPLIYTIALFLFLCLSSSVKNAIPPKERKLGRDIYILSAL